MAPAFVVVGVSGDLLQDARPRQGGLPSGISTRYVGSIPALPSYPVRPASRFPNSNQEYFHPHRFEKKYQILRFP
jgi:hypothetical protein